jgi:hypothetical protein
LNGPVIDAPNSRACRRTKSSAKKNRQLVAHLSKLPWLELPRQPNPESGRLVLKINQAAVCHTVRCGGEPTAQAVQMGLSVMNNAPTELRHAAITIQKTEPAAASSGISPCCSELDERRLN